jgi:hypothetical protein
MSSFAFSGISEAADGDVALVAVSFCIKSAKLEAIGVKDIARRPQDRGEEIRFTRDGLFGWQPRRERRMAHAKQSHGLGSLAAPLGKFCSMLAKQDDKA